MCRESISRRIVDAGAIGIERGHCQITGRISGSHSIAEGQCASAGAAGIGGGARHR